MFDIDEVDVEDILRQLEKRPVVPAPGGVHDVDVVAHEDNHQDGNYGDPAHTDQHADHLIK